MSKLGEGIRRCVNAMAGVAGARLVNRQWGPRGFAAALDRVKRLGLAPRQVVDAGAASGMWTRECLGVFPDARYLLVDPLLANEPALRAMAAANPTLRVWMGALGSTAARLPIHPHGDQSSFFASEFSAGPGHVQELEVRPLDSFLGSELLEPPDLIKADVQGYELEVLRGAERCLETTEVLLLETSFRQVYRGCPLAHEVIAWVGARGFRIYDICSYSQRPHDLELFQADIMFVRNGSKAFAYEGYD